MNACIRTAALLVAGLLATANTALAEESQWYFKVTNDTESRITSL